MKKLFLVFITLMLLVLSGCSGSKENKTLDRLDRIKEKGYIEFVTEPYWAPNEFIDPTKSGDEQYVGTDIGMKGMIKAAEVMALASIRTMNDVIIEEAKNELIRKNGGKYECPLPENVLPPIGKY